MHPSSRTYFPLTITIVIGIAKKKKKKNLGSLNFNINSCAAVFCLSKEMFKTENKTQT